MPVTFLPFGPYRGPAGSKFGDGLARADNVLPVFSDLYPLRNKTTVVYATVADGPVTGGHIHVWPVSPGTASYLGDAATIFVGTKTKIYYADAGAFTSTGKAANYAQTVGDEPSGWRGASFGNHVYMTNYVDPIQKRTNNAGLFADGPTSTLIPEARFIATVRQFMFAADIHNGGYFSDQILWSDIDDADWWDDFMGTRDTSLAGQQRILSRPGQITGLVGGSWATIFKRASIHAMQYIGGSDIWRLDEIAFGTGTSHPGSIVSAPSGIYFFDGRSFRVMRGLSPPEKISPPEIDQLLADPVHQSTRTMIHGLPTKLVLEDAVMRGFWGDRSGCIYWTWANTTVDGGTDGPYAHDRGLVYNPETGAWAAIFSSGLNLTIALTVPPVVDSTTNTVALDRGINVFDWNGSSTSWSRFEAGSLQADLGTKRQPIAMNGATGQAHRVRLKAVLPAFSMADGTTYSASPTAPAVPNCTVVVTCANEPHYEVQSDGSSTVSPRSETLTRTLNANDAGWMPCTLEGAWWDFLLTIPAGAEWISCSGLYLDYEVVG